MKKEKVRYSLKTAENRTAFCSGIKDGIPIGLGYLAVSFSLGIAARNIGLTPFQGFLVSALCSASAGEYVGFTMIAASASYIEMAIATFVTNVRYLLMSCALSQKFQPGTSLLHRLCVAFHVTDELFGIAIARPGYLNPCYSYGAAIVAAACWSFGTMLGVIAGNLLPARLVSAFGVALYGMFLAVIIPQAKKDKVVAGLIVICFVASYFAAYIPGLSGLAEGTRNMILTVVISAAAALLFPKNTEEEAA